MYRAAVGRGSPAGDRYARGNDRRMVATPHWRRRHRQSTPATTGRPLNRHARRRTVATTTAGPPEQRGCGSGFDTSDPPAFARLSRHLSLRGADLLSVVVTGARFAERALGICWPTKRLRDNGHDVLAVLDGEVGLASRSDEDVLAWASRTNQCVVTENVADFARLGRPRRYPSRQHIRRTILGDDHLLCRRLTL